MFGINRKPAVPPVHPHFVPAKGPVEVIFSSAVEAFWSAFVAWILGGVAISIASGFAGDMVPSLPPIFAAQQQSNHGHHGQWWHSVRGAGFALFYAIFFAHSLWRGFRGHGGGGAAETRIWRILYKLRKNWFGLIVGNAIGAWIALLVLNIVQDFSPVQILWHFLWGMVFSVLAQVGHFIFGASSANTVGAWFSWYGDNQNKLNYWILYFSGAFDDLGVPNFKTLARWGWHRFRGRKGAVEPFPDEQEDLS
jgi:hypothetical protein